MPFIKSHSNYVLKSKHQDVNDGTIFERDITTIGAVDQFSPGQTPIYRSNNFIITIRNDGRPANQYNTTKWKENDEGEIWTLQSISGMISDYEDDDDTKIVLKQDYFDFRDFAYYGSLTELFRASVTDIIAKFPGELYVTNDHAYYTVRKNYDFDKIETQYPLGWYKEGSDTEPKYYLVSNPFNINLHSSHVPNGADPLKYFAEEGYLNYQIGSGETIESGCTSFEDIKWCDIVDVIVEYHDPCSKKPDSCDCEDMTVKPFTPADCKCEDMTVNPFTPTRNRGKSVMGAKKTANDEEESEEYYRRVATIEIKYVCKDDKGNITSQGSILIYAYLDDANRIVYLVDDEKLEGLHIRPRKSFIAKFYNEIDNFQKLLVNRDTNYKATFSVIRENNFGYYREFVPFQFPIADGGYNLDATDYGFNEYTTKMVEIGEYYDENFTDNLWRSMTHEAIKNFDWTYTREYVEGDEEEYVLGGQKIQKALRVFGREFDEIISYINSIKNLNRITYDERNNIPDYFLTDVVENEGWDVKLVYPYDLTEYHISTNYVFSGVPYSSETQAYSAALEAYSADTPTELRKKITKRIEKIEIIDSGNTKWTEGGESCDGQLNNKVKSGSTVLDIVREFSQNASDKVKPYAKWMIKDGTEDGFFIVCDCDKNSSAIKKTKEILEIPEDEELAHCGYDDTNLTFIIPQAISCATMYLDDCALSGKGVLKNRIKAFTDEAEWSYQEVNNEFLKRLKLNSTYIWRHKGTIDGIEMILGMFGMKSKRWVEAHPSWLRNCKYSKCFEEETETGKKEECFLLWDYDVQEYTSFAERIEETWDVIHQNYRINWINSTKSITYDNRFVSNYNKYGANQDTLPYQGIPVSFRDAYLSQSGETYEPYMQYKIGENKENFFYYNINNEKIIKRYLYPYFNKNEELDGNPYFQMRGGWLSKEIINSGNTWNFQFNVDDLIVYNKYLESGYTDDSGFTYDNEPLYTETIRNIRRADNIASLLSIPTVELYNGVICYVTQIEKNSAVVDNVVYPITREWYVSGLTSSGHSVSYITFVKTDGFFKIGSSKFFDSTIIVYDVDGNEHIYDIEEMPDGTQLKAYIKDDGTFICKEDGVGNYSISNFQILGDERESGFTNYFVLDDVNYADVLARYELSPYEVSSETPTEEEEPKIVGNWTSGWRRLAYSDKEYLKISTIVNYYEGNNPHNGKMIYDNGHEYFTYFNRIFKHASDNDLFDERCYEDYYETLDEEIRHYGFSGLIENNEDILQYDMFLIPDTKIHYFGDYKVNIYTLRDKNGMAKASADTMFSFTNENGVTTSGATDYARASGFTIQSSIDKVWIYGDDSYRLSGKNESGGFDVIYITETDNVSGYNLSATTEEGWVEFYDSASTKDYSNPYNPVSGHTSSAITVIDDITNQIVNNKIFDITFRLHNIWYSKKGQEELKYIDNIVMNYLTQMIPSTTILRVKYDLLPFITSDGEETSNNS